MVKMPMRSDADDDSFRKNGFPLSKLLLKIHYFDTSLCTPSIVRGAEWAPLIVTGTKYITATGFQVMCNVMRSCVFLSHYLFHVSVIYQLPSSTRLT